MQLTPEILKERKTGIGGSDCAAVLGLSKWSTPLDIYLSKIDPDLKPKETNDAMKWGHILEPVVIKEYEDITLSKVEQPNKIFRNDKFSWMLANLDGIVAGKNMILEAKTTRFFSDQWGEPGSDYIPNEYLYQIAHYCIVMDMPSVDIAALGGGSDFRIYHYNRNKELEQQIIDATHDFWHNNVLKQVPPEPVDNSDLIKLYRKGDESKTLVADEKISGYAYKQRQIKNQIAELKKQNDFVEMEIKAAMKDNAFLVDIDGIELASWKNQVTNRFQTKDFKAENQELYNQFCEPAESRVLRNKIK